MQLSKSFDRAAVDSLLSRFKNLTKPKRAYLMEVRRVLCYTLPLLPLTGLVFVLLRRF